MLDTRLAEGPVADVKLAGRDGGAPQSLHLRLGQPGNQMSQVSRKLKIKYLKKIPKMLRNHEYSLGIKFYKFMNNK